MDANQEQLQPNDGPAPDADQSGVSEFDAALAELSNAGQAPSPSEPDGAAALEAEDDQTEGAGDAQAPSPSGQRSRFP